MLATPAMRRLAPCGPRGQTGPNVPQPAAEERDKGLENARIPSSGTAEPSAMDLQWKTILATRSDVHNGLNGRHGENAQPLAEVAPGLRPGNVQLTMN